MREEGRLLGDNKEIVSERTKCCVFLQIANCKIDLVCYFKIENFSTKLIR